MDYKIEHKAAFTLTGYGTSLEAAFAGGKTDFAAIAAQKASFWNGLIDDGRFHKLKKVAKNTLEWSVNEVYQGKPWNYFAVETASEIADATRLVEFPDSDYVVIEGTGDAATLFDMLAGQAFGQILPALTDYAYVGGPNGTYRAENADGSYSGAILIPVVAK
ncbi:MAG: GyrI-like domain-containing protein [Streptococcaceae bacterium]|nr:GyrI-like domain-containing protein [Streptococcaceae bacterium]